MTVTMMTPRGTTRNREKNTVKNARNTENPKYVPMMKNVLKTKNSERQENNTDKNEKDTDQTDRQVLKTINR